MEKYKVTLTSEERRDLEKFVSSGKAAVRKQNHARILLLTDEGEERKGRVDEDIAEILNIGLRTISRVRKRFVTEGIECRWR